MSTGPTIIRSRTPAPCHLPTCRRPSFVELHHQAANALITTGRAPTMDQARGCPGCRVAAQLVQEAVQSGRF